MTSPQDIKEILVELAFLATPDSFHYSTSNAQDMVENTFEFYPKGMPSAQSGDSVYQGPGLISTSVTALALQADDARSAAFVQGITKLPSLHGAVVKLLDEELEEIYPEFASPKYKLNNKVKAVANGRHMARQALMSGSRTSRKGYENYDFKVVLNNFENDKKNGFLRERNLRFYFDDSSDHFLDALRIGTSHCTVPPPSPYPSFETLPVRFDGSEFSQELSAKNEQTATGDSRHIRSDSVSSSDSRSTWNESTDRPALGYSAHVLPRADKERGYSLEDGPWIYRIQKADKINFGPQNLLSSRDDFTKMIDALKIMLKKYPDIHLTVKMVHSQDRVAQKNWVYQARKNDVENAEKRKEEDERVDNVEFELAISKLLVEGEPVEGLYEDCLRQ